MNTLAAGTYRFTHNYTSNLYIVTEGSDTVEILSVPTAHYPTPERVNVITCAELEARIEARAIWSEYVFTAAPRPVIGKARAAKLHKIMARLGLSHDRHYGLAAAALCEPFPLDSLATLTEQEARRVWAHLCRCYPSARKVAA